MPFKDIDKRKKYNKEWLEKNVDKRKEYQNKYNKKYYNENVDKILEKQKEYNNKNIDKIKEYKKEQKKETIYCNCCKKDINKAHKLRHYKTQLHINNSTCKKNC